MRVKTTLSNDLDLADYKGKLDELCKRLLSNKTVIAWIMKSCMKEYNDYEIADIAQNYIEGIPEVARVTVHMDEKCDGEDEKKSDEKEVNLESQRRNVGLNTEDSSVTEGKVTYDIRFIAILPKSGEWLKLIINIEAQDKFYPGYPLIKRGFYYGCRLISAQYGTEFIHSHYEKIKKVYSIWICMNPPDYRKNTITKYSMSEENIVGNVREKVEYYDLLNLIMICLGDGQSQKEQNDGILRLLNVLFSKELSVVEKKRILHEEFELQMTEELEQEVQDMCNYSDGIERQGYERGIKEGINVGKKEGLQEGREKGREEGRTEGIQEGISEGRNEGLILAIRNLMKTMSLTIAQAMDILLIPEEDREKYENMIRYGEY